VILQAGGYLSTYSLAQRKFCDGMCLHTAAGARPSLLSFDRPSAHLWTTPDGRIFFMAALDGAASRSLAFYEAVVARDGNLTVRPHLAVELGSGGKLTDFDGVVRCFLPDLARRDGSYDFVLGGNQELGQPTVRVIDDFIPPRPDTK
jgi:hypothetical protein